MDTLSKKTCPSSVRGSGKMISFDSADRARCLEAYVGNFTSYELGVSRLFKSHPLAGVKILRNA